uniref:Umc1506 n=1 Tax=Arundo donax TaxID=35708 RepID=A0A0A9D5S8_ARUDO
MMLLLYFFPKIIPLLAAKATFTEVFRDWTIVPSNPRMLSRSLQSNSITWICKATTEGHQKKGQLTEHVWHQESKTPIYQNHRVIEYFL